MNEPKQQATWSTILLSVAFLVALILIAAPLGTRFGLWPWGVGLRSLLAVAIGGSAVAIVAVITFFVARKPGGAANRRRAAMAFVVAVLPAAFMWAQILYARTLPMIHDISTDTTNPPVFTSAPRARGRANEYAPIRACRHRGQTTRRISRCTTHPDIDLARGNI